MICASFCGESRSHITPDGLGARPCEVAARVRVRVKLRVRVRVRVIRARCVLTGD